jgi:hypothetical protein
MRNATEMTPYDQEERLLIIQQSYGQGRNGGLPTYKDLAERCKCSEGTIYNDMRVWKEEGGLELFIITEFESLYPLMKENEPLETFKILSKFLLKGVKQKVSVDQRIQVGMDYTTALKGIFVPAEDVRIIEDDGDKTTDDREEPAEVIA